MYITPNRNNIAAVLIHLVSTSTIKENENIPIAVGISDQNNEIGKIHNITETNDEILSVSTGKGLNPTLRLLKKTTLNNKTSKAPSTMITI